MIKTIAVTLAAVATVANGDTNLRSNAQVQGSRCKNTDLSKDTNLLNRWCQTHPWLNNGQYCMWQCPEGELKITCRGNQGWEKQRCAPAAPQGTKFYAIMGKISGRKNKLAPGIGVHCLDRGTTTATEAPYDNKHWKKHNALSVQCCGADNYRDNSDPLKKWVVKEQGNVFATRFTRNVVPGGAWNLDACETGKTLDEAFAICADKGLRMCTKDEVMANEQNMGCNTGSNLQWTDTPCDGAVGGTPNKDVSTELEEIRTEFKDLVAAEEPLTEEEEKADDKFDCTTDKNFITGSYSQIEVNLNGQPSRKIFDEYEAVAFCRNECDKREASGAGCKAFWYQRHGPNPNDSRGTHGYKLCAFYKQNGQAVRHGHGGKSQVCVRKAGSAGAVASPAPAAAGNTGNQYYLTKNNQNCGATANVITSKEECKIALKAVGKSDRIVWNNVHQGIPGGCSVRGHADGHYDNRGTSGTVGETRGDLHAVCKGTAPASAAAPPAAAPPAAGCKQTSKTYNQGARCQGSGYRKTVGWCCSAYGKKKGYQWK